MMVGVVGFGWIMETAREAFFSFLFSLFSLFHLVETHSYL